MDRHKSRKLYRRKPVIGEISDHMPPVSEACRRNPALRVLITSVLILQGAAAQPPPVFQYGKEPIFIPSEMPAVVRTWHPANNLNEPGIKKGPPFEAALVRVFNEDTDWSSEIAVFRFRDGTARAWKSRSFSQADVKLMRDMKAKAPIAPVDSRKWTTQLDEATTKRVKDGELNQHETRHFVFIWGNAPEATAKAAMSKPKFIEQAGEWFEKVWTAYEVDFQAPMPYVGDRRPVRIQVNLYGTGIPGVGSGWANSAKAMALDPRAIFYGSTVVGHEFGHVVQAYTGGFMIRSSGGPWWETHAETGSFNCSPTHGDALGTMFTHLNHGCQWPESRYSNWAILMQLWEKKRTRQLVYGIWTKNRRDRAGASEEDPLETTVRLGKADGSLPEGWDSFGEEIGEMAARMVTMDYLNQGYLRDASSEMRKKTMSQLTASATSPGWFDAPADKPLYAYGAHWIPVTPAAGASQIAVSFRGNSKATDAKWRLTLVTVDRENSARYSPRITATGSTEAKVILPVKPGEEYVLVVAATPTKYRSLTWNQTPEFSFPYSVNATGASLAGASR